MIPESRLMMSCFNSDDLDSAILVGSQVLKICTMIEIDVYVEAWYCKTISEVYDHSRLYNKRIVFDYNHVYVS